MAGKRRVAITGTGLICASGIGSDNVWERCLSGHNSIREITRFDTTAYRCKVGGEIDGFNPADYVQQQIIQQTDRSAHLGMAACQLAADEAGLNLTDEDPTQVGMYFSNLVGGMDFAEPELYAQTFMGPSRVSAYQAIAWFYAATQGQWSIKTGIKGHAKTVVADRTGGLQSVGLAAHAIRRGHCRVAFAGGFEAPIVPYAFLMYGTTGLLSNDATDPSRAYRPFHSQRNGLVLGEGSGILILEDLEHALERKARIYAEVTGFAVAMDAPLDAPGSGLARCFSEALSSSGLHARDIDHISAEGAATMSDDKAEAAAIHDVFGGVRKKPSVSSPKSMFGHTLAAAGAIDVALASRMMLTNTVLPTVHLDEPDPSFSSAHFNSTVEEKTLNAIMCSTRGIGGLNAALVMQKYVQ
jgi:3-oxoacyl-[acyl-carrier-protein] synthase II